MSAEHTPTSLRELCGKLEDHSVLNDMVGIVQVRSLLEPAVDEAEARESELKRRVEEMLLIAKRITHSEVLQNRCEKREYGDEDCGCLLCDAEAALAKAKEATS